MTVTDQTRFCDSRDCSNAEIHYPGHGCAEKIVTTVCDYCVNEAYDAGIEGYDAQVEAMLLVGADVADHLCDVTEERDYPLRCHCPCKPTLKDGDGYLAPTLRSAEYWAEFRRLTDGV